MITNRDIRHQVETAVSAGGSDLAEGIDTDAITAEIITTYGLIDIDARDEDDEQVIPHDVFWSMVQRHDSTQLADRIASGEGVAR